jgi:outer membrane receptor protein involved in Fe transport
MPIIRPIACGLVATLAFATGASAGQAAGSQPSPGQGQAQGQTQKPPPTPPPTQPPPTNPQDVNYKETVVVSASKTEQQLIDAPATMSVIGPRALNVAPSTNYADLLRNVPGVNITQISARDVNVTSRGATSSLATSQLTVVDGRSVYQDFFGFTMWDFVPSNVDEIKRIEVIRGPASAVWGANALNGVVNVLTKSPREMPGTWATFGVGGFGREVADNGAAGGSLFFVRGTHAQVANDRWSYKVSAGTYSGDAFARPVGNVPNGQPRPTPYPPYENQGTTQPKFDARVDYDFPEGDRKLQFSGGVAGTEGIMHSGIGPFDIDGGSKMGYWKVNYLQKAFKLQAFMNFLDGEATNLVSVDPTGQAIGLDFDTKTFDLELGDTRLVGGKHVLTYGGNLRFNRFHLTIAPGEDSRNEGGAYIQDEFLASDMFKVVAGARVDKFSSIDNAVFSPRVAVVIKPKPDHSVRASYNRAFRAPSMVNNNLDTTIATALPLGAINPIFGSAIYYVPTRAVGNPELTEELIDAFEVAYTGSIRNRATVSVAWYYNKWSDQILFTQVAEWGPTTPPPGFPGLGPIPPAAIWGQLYAQGIRFPSEFTYENFGELSSQGIELGVEGSIRPNLTGFVNYAFQTEPDPNFPDMTDAEALTEINLPAQHLFSIGVTYTGEKMFGTFSVSHQSDAYWQDVLDARFHGPTNPFTSVNFTIGMRWQNGRYSAALKCMNLGNQEIQQHIFGDIIRRQFIGEFRVQLPR